MRHHPGCLYCFVNYINDIDDHYNVVALPTGAVAKYCDEYVCACVCNIYVCMSAKLFPKPHAPSLPFWYMLFMAVARSFSDGVTKSQKRGNFWGFLPN